MNIEIQFVDAVRNEELITRTEEKINKLCAKYEWITNAAVFFKNEKHADGKDYLCEIRLSVPGPQLFAKSFAVNLQAAMNAAIQELTIQLEKKKDKIQEKR